jgi:hypothetical protein
LQEAVSKVIEAASCNKPVEIPVNPVMAKIIDKYRGQTQNGYIFPIMDDEKEKDYKTKDYFFKKFRAAV